MRNPDPPYLELGFYFRRESGRESLRFVAETLTTSFGAVPREACAVDHTGPSLNRAKEARERTSTLDSTDDLVRLLRNPSIFVRKVRFDGGTRVVQDAQEFLVALPIEGTDCKDENNVIAIWVEGASFSRDPNSQISKKEKQVAARVLTAFRKLVSLLRPTYASITVDYGLENPCDLRHDPRSLAFRDFYLDRDVFGEKFLEKLRSKFPTCVYDDNEGGQFTITTAAFRLAVGDDSGGGDGYKLSEFVGRSIGNLIV